MSSLKVKQYNKIFNKYIEKIDETLFDKVEILKEIQTLPVDITKEIGKFDEKSLSDNKKEKLKKHLKSAMISARVNEKLAIEIGKFFGRYYKRREGDLKWLFEMKQIIEEEYEEYMEYLSEDEFGSDLSYDSECSYDDIWYENVISIVDRIMQKFQ